jgi:hypothetical protein
MPFRAGLVPSQFLSSPVPIPLLPLFATFPGPDSTFPPFPLYLRPKKKYLPLSALKTLKFKTIIFRLFLPNCHEIMTIH